MELNMSAAFGVKPIKSPNKLFLCGLPSSPAGISGKSQVLFALVFTTRYLDLATSFVSVYNTVMKLVFIATAYGTLYLIFVKFRATYDANHDTFRAEFLVIPAAGLALLVNHEFSVMEVSLRRDGLSFLDFSRKTESLRKCHLKFCGVCQHRGTSNQSAVLVLFLLRIWVT